MKFKITKGERVGSYILLFILMIIGGINIYVRTCSSSNDISCEEVENTAEWLEYTNEINIQDSLAKCKHHAKTNKKPKKSHYQEVGIDTEVPKIK